MALTMLVLVPLLLGQVDDHNVLVAGVSRNYTNFMVTDGCFVVGNNIRQRTNQLRLFPLSNLQLCSRNIRCTGFQIYMRPESTLRTVYIEYKTDCACRAPGVRARAHARASALGRGALLGSRGLRGGPAHGPTTTRSAGTVLPEIACQPPLGQAPGGDWYAFRSTVRCANLRTSAANATNATARPAPAASSVAASRCADWARWCAGIGAASQQQSRCAERRVQAHCPATCGACPAGGAQPQALIDAARSGTRARIGSVSAASSFDGLAAARWALVLGGALGLYALGAFAVGRQARAAEHGGEPGRPGAVLGARSASKSLPSTPGCSSPSCLSPVSASMAATLAVDSERLPRSSSASCVTQSAADGRPHYSSQLHLHSPATALLL